MQKNSRGQYGDRPAKLVPNLVCKNQLKSQNSNTKKFKGIKCACGKSWCPSCGKKTSVYRFTKKICDWDWSRVRQAIMTVDPNLYPDAEAALKTINREKYIPNAMRNLERTKGIEIEDYQWTLEFHRNGYPHWHVFILVENAGRAGMIGGDNLRTYWKSGRVTESYIRNENHWKKIIGYFQKHGYFNKKKAYQSRLPDWAREKTYVIRRTGGKTHPTDKQNFIEKEKFLEREERREDPDKRRLDELLIGAELGDWFFKQANKESGKTEGEKLDACGCETDLYSGFGFNNYLGRAKMPYQDFRSMKGEYIEGEGYIVELDHNQLNDLMMKIGNRMNGGRMNI
jgi:hypothetical protein